MKNINQTAENPQNKSSSKKANMIKTFATAAFITVAGAVNGQNGGTAVPKYHNTPGTAYTIPNLPNGSEYYLKIVNGDPIYITIDGMDAGSGIFYRLSSPTKTINANTIKAEDIDAGNRLVNYTENGVTRAIGLTINDIVKAKNKTTGDESDVQFGDGEYTAGTHMAYYRWRNMNESLISSGYRDSTKTLTQGQQYIVETTDKSGLLPQGMSRDTIAVIERPSANSTARTLDFTTTVSGVNYKVYKYQPAAAGAPMSKAPSENAVDSAWIEVPSLSFVGDGNPRSVGVELGSYRIGAQRTASTAIQQDTKSLKVDLGTEVLEVSDKPEFVVNGHTLYFKEAVKSYQVVDMNGHIIKTGQGNTANIPQTGAFIVLIEKASGKKTHGKFIISK